MRTAKAQAVLPVHFKQSQDLPCSLFSSHWLTRASSSFVPQFVAGSSGRAEPQTDPSVSTSNVECCSRFCSNEQIITTQGRADCAVSISHLSPGCDETTASQHLPTFGMFPGALKPGASGMHGRVLPGPGSAVLGSVCLPVLPLPVCILQAHSDVH